MTSYKLGQLPTDWKIGSIDGSIVFSTPCFLGPGTDSTPQTASRSVQPLLHSSMDARYTGIMYQKNIAVLKVTVLYTVGLLNTAVYRPVVLITFRVSRRRREMYCAHARLCVCLCVCLSAAACLHYCTDPDVTWGSGRGCPLVVHYWADLQSVHGLRCYGNTRNAWPLQARCTSYSNSVRLRLSVCHTPVLCQNDCT